MLPFMNQRDLLIANAMADVLTNVLVGSNFCLLLEISRNFVQIQMIQI